MDNLSDQPLLNRATSKSWQKNRSPYNHIKQNDAKQNIHYPSLAARARLTHTSARPKGEKENSKREHSHR